MKDQSKTLTPKLRFPEFKDETGWDGRTIGAICVLKAGEFVAGSDIADELQEGFYPCYGGNGLRGYVRSFTHDGRYVLVGRQGALCGNVNLFSGKFHATEHALVATPKHGTDTDWLHYALDLLKLNRFSIGQAQPGLSVGVLNGVNIAFPSDEDEQRKIAACLTSLDELLAAEGRKLEGLRGHKKGLMQQLFPREGESRSRLRFPEFRDAGEWEEKRLDEIADFQSGGTPSKSKPAFWNGSIPWVSAKDMKRMVLDDTEDHISDAAVEDGAKVVPAGTVLMLTRGMTLLKDIPICLLARPMALNQDVRALRPSNGFDGHFLAYMLVGNKQRIRSMVDIAGHGTGRLNTDRLKALDLLFPSPAEQQRIAACLSSLDALIAAQSRKLDGLRAHKKGLMQQLFPNPQESVSPRPAAGRGVGGEGK